MKLTVYNILINTSFKTEHGRGGEGRKMPSPIVTTPLLPMRRRAQTDYNLERKSTFSGPREVHAESTMLDRLVFCYDQRPVRQSGFWLRPSLSSAHFSFKTEASDSTFSEQISDSVQLSLIAYSAFLEGSYPLEIEVDASSSSRLHGAIGNYIMSDTETQHGFPIWEKRFNNSPFRIESTAEGYWTLRYSFHSISSLEPHNGRAPSLVRKWEDSSLNITSAPTMFLQVVAWLALFLGVTGMSSIGPVATRFSSINGMLLGCWIAQALFLSFLTISLIHSYISRNTIQQGRPLSWLWKWNRRDSDIAKGGLPVVLLAGLSSGLGSGCWTLSFTLTPIPLAYLFASFSPSVIVLCRILAPSAGAPPDKWEVIGVCVGILGGIVTCSGGLTGGSVTTPLSVLMLGNFLAFVCSISNAICGMCGKFASCVPTVYYLTAVCFLSFVAQLMLSYFIVPGGITFTTDPNSGVFGWMNPGWRFPFSILVFAFVVGQWGLFFFLHVGTALQQAMVMTTQPVITTVLGVAVLGTQSEWPSAVTSAGGLICIMGSVIVIVCGQHHEIE